MNSLTRLLKTIVLPSIGRPPVRGIKYGYVSGLNYENGRDYCGVDITDFSGQKYYVGYTCRHYIPMIDQMIEELILDLPKEEYNISRHIMASLINRRLIHIYGINYEVKLELAGRINSS